MNKNNDWKLPDLGNAIGKSIQIFIIDKINSGLLSPGDALPPYREIAKINNVNRNTVYGSLTSLTLLARRSQDRGLLQRTASQ